MHAAKFDNEKDSENIRQAILRYEIEHPVVNDSEMIVARSSAFAVWPTLCVVDPEGQFVRSVSGEGNRELLDRVVGEMVAFHRAKGTLKEEPLRFDLERNRVQPGAVQVSRQGARRRCPRTTVHLRQQSQPHRHRLARRTAPGSDRQRTDRCRGDSFEEASFDHPQGMALDGETLYVADTENHLIRKIDLTNQQVSTLAGIGEQARSRGPGGALRETALNSPWDLTIRMACYTLPWPGRISCGRIACRAT